MQNRWIAMILVLSLAMNTAVLTVAGYKYYKRNRDLSEATLHSQERNYHFLPKTGAHTSPIGENEPYGKYLP